MGIGSNDCEVVVEVASVEVASALVVVTIGGEVVGVDVATASVVGASEPVAAAVVGSVDLVVPSEQPTATSISAVGRTVRVRVRLMHKR